MQVLFKSYRSVLSGLKQTATASDVFEDYAVVSASRFCWC